MNQETILSCMQGYVKPLSESKDKAFREKLSGDGVLITPSSSMLMSPFDGTVVLVFSTKHAIILRRDDGLALVIHVGIEVDKLKGDGFIVHVVDGQDVHQGDLLMELDTAYLKSIHYDTDTHVLFPSLGIRELKQIHYGEIKFLEPLCEIE